MAVVERILDTSAYSYFKRGNRQAVHLIQETDKIWIPVIVMGELLAGFSAGTRKQQNVDELDDFLAMGRVEIANVNSRTAERYSAIHLWLRNAGRPIPANDIWISAIAMEKGADLISADAHFEHLPQIQHIKLIK
ncbi:MAG: type II toxin-antitoxin system VapC family toxin [Chloroflexota bacterium]